MDKGQWVNFFRVNVTAPDSSGSPTYQSVQGIEGKLAGGSRVRWGVLADSVFVPDSDEDRPRIAGTSGRTISVPISAVAEPYSDINLDGNVDQDDISEIITAVSGSGCS